MSHQNTTQHKKVFFGPIFGTWYTYFCTITKLSFSLHWKILHRAEWIRRIVQCSVDTKSCLAEPKIDRVTWVLAQGAGGTPQGTNSMCQDWSEKGTVRHSQFTPEGNYFLRTEPRTKSAQGRYDSQMHCLWGHNESSQPLLAKQLWHICCQQIYFPQHWFALEVNYSIFGVLNIHLLINWLELVTLKLQGGP